MTNLEEEEEEEMDQQSSKNEQKSKLPASSQDQEMESDDDEDDGTDDGESEEEDEDEEESSEPEVPEMLVPNRSKRINAGKKMQELLSQQAEQGDEFYKTAYGGFGEMDHDDDFQSPPHSSDEEEAEADEVDSDFDRPEEEENGEEINRAMDDAERNEQKKKKQKQKQLLERNKNWAIARINKASVPENICDPKTQRQRLEEAKKTAELNIASLKRFEEFELERKKRQAKGGPKMKLEGPRIREIMTADGMHLLVLPEIPPKEQLFPRPERREYRVCAVTGRPARYIDPLTRLPYADADAFRTIREKYSEFMRAEIATAGSEGEEMMGAMVNNGGDSNGIDQAGLLAGGFSMQQTPAKQRKLAEGQGGSSAQQQHKSYLRIRVDDMQ